MPFSPMYASIYLTMWYSESTNLKNTSSPAVPICDSRCAVVFWVTSKHTLYVSDPFVEPGRFTFYSMATSCSVSFSTTSLPANISILGTADSKSPRRRLQFRCLSMDYSSGIYPRSHISCKSMSELLSYLLSKLSNLLDNYNSGSVNFTIHLLCADTTILLSSDVPFSRRGGS